VSALARLVRGIFRRSRVERFIASHTTTVVLAEDMDAVDLCDLATAIFGEHVWVCAHDSEDALELLNQLGERYDVAFSQ
jgi:hypothetical protein